MKQTSETTADIIITGGLVIDPTQNLEAIRDVYIKDGKITDLKRASELIGGQYARASGTRVIDARGKWVLPGLIDMHVHLREPGREQDETIASGARAAAIGGVTTVLAMPNTEPVVDTAAMVHFLRDRAKADGLVNVLVAGAVTKGQKGCELAEMGKMAEAGAVAMTDDGRPVMNALLMRRALEYAKGYDLPVLDHCEDIHLSADGVMHEGSACAVKGLPGVPAAAETVMAMRDIALAELTGARLHLCHVSCAETVDLVRRAKKRGVRVTAEAAPHHFTLCDEDIPGYDADFKMSPPLRSRADVEALRRGLSDGAIDAVATDHAPHSPSKKALGLVAAPNGVIGLETSFSLTAALIEAKVLTRRSLVERMSCAPARILGLKTKGGLKPGMDADLVVMDPKAQRILDGGQSLSRNTPFKGRRLKGRADFVLVGGRVVVDGGRLA